MSSTDDDLLALRLRALGHPARLAIVRALADRDTCMCGEIVRGLTLAQSTVSQHLKVLKEAGLIAGTVEGPRSCYCLDRVNFAALQADLGPLLSQAMESPATRNPPLPDSSGVLVSGPGGPISAVTAGDIPASS